jgi:hypothetical protein
MRKKRILKLTAIFLLVIQSVEMFMPLSAYALTSGPSAPEVQSFEPSGTTEMVNLFTGDFTYNIPLFELPGPNGGYPFNLAYNAGIGMDQEASWVGLGWNLNPGAINRDIRGIPDDFNGDPVSIKNDMKDNWTVGVKAGLNFEGMGFDIGKGWTMDGGIGMRLYYNSYNGMGYSIGPEISFGKAMGNNTNANLGLGINLDSEDGIDLNPSVSFTSHDEYEHANDTKLTTGIGFNSKNGLVGLSFNLSNESQKIPAKTKSQNKSRVSFGSNISFASNAFTPYASPATVGYGGSFNLSFGLSDLGLYPNFKFSGDFFNQTLKSKNTFVDVKSYGYLNLQNDGDKAGMIDFNRERDGVITKKTPNLANPQLTFDVYSIQGQGVGGMFRPFRSDIGSVYDARVNSEMGSGAFGIGFGFGPSGGIKVDGLDASVNYGNSSSGRWNDAAMNFKGLENTDPTFEPYYFKILGEETTEPLYLKDYMGGNETVRIDLDDNLNAPNKQVALNKDLVAQNLQEKRGSYNNSKRKPRNTSISTLSNAEISNTGGYGISDYAIHFYALSDEVYDGSQASESGIYAHLMPNGIVNREDMPGNNTYNKGHIGAYTVLDPTGSRYIYALPVYNTKSVDKLYSASSGGNANLFTNKNLTNEVDEGDAHTQTSMQYLKETQLPPYAINHLLTSILGADYVDLTNDGPTDDDFGYWVKFQYKKVNTETDPYKWRAPYYGANFIKGLNVKIDDDKASFLYGEREMYYLVAAETKSHIAYFDIAKRADARGATIMEEDAAISQESGATLSTGPHSYRLDKIVLVSKAEMKAITTVHFKYNYELCKGVENYNTDDADEDPDHVDLTTTGKQTGKLTLKSLWFTYENSNRGSLNKYLFDYGDIDHDGVQDANPSYNRLFQDRWGQYKDYAGATMDKYSFPYVNQEEDAASKEKRTMSAAAWCLTSIKTPTGSTIKVNYESDDYGYVQNRSAAQMFNITRFQSTTGSPQNRIYKDYKLGQDWNDQEESRKVYFKLESSVEVSDFANVSEQKQYLRQTYLSDIINPDGVPQIYFKALMDIRKPDDGGGTFREYISGYAIVDIEPSGGPRDYDCGLYDADYNGIAEEAWVRLKPVKAGKKIIQGHPFSVYSWMYLRTNLPDVYTADGTIQNAPSTDSEREVMARNLANGLTQISDLFTRFYERSFRNNFGKFVDPTTEDINGVDVLKYAVIRLNTPDMRKYGGGHRVKSIVISDDWGETTNDTDQKSEYGVVYEYGETATNDLNDEPYFKSYGVAQYEPVIGGDEIALRYARIYPDGVSMKSKNNMYFEYPINENYFPGPVVGYSKVIVKSLATDRQVNYNNYSTEDQIAVEASTTGETVHEFYTAKDFPVFTNMTTLKSKRDITIPSTPKLASKIIQKLLIPLPGLGNIAKNSLTASQGYKIELNDMHGKPKQITYYGVGGDRKIDRKKPVSYVKYNYLCEQATTDAYRPPALKLKNTVDVLTAEGQTSTMEMGTDYEFFTDSRESLSSSGQGGLSFNLDGINLYVVYIPAFIPWPNVSYTENNTRLIVANKIIHRAGILGSTEAFDGESKVVTENLFYDAASGRPLLTRVNNNFDDPVYNYNIPAHWAYDQIGSAYKNISMFAKCQISADLNACGVKIMSTDDKTATISNVNNSGFTKHLVAGDRLLLLGGNDFSNPLGSVSVITSNEAGAVVRSFESSITLSNNFGGSYAIVGTSFITGIKVIQSGRRNQIQVDAANIKSLSNPLLGRTYAQCTFGSGGVTPTSMYMGMLETFLNQIIMFIGKKYQDHGFNYLLTNSPVWFNSSDPDWNTYITMNTPVQGMLIILSEDLVTGTRSMNVRLGTSSTPSTNFCEFEFFFDSNNSCDEYIFDGIVITSQTSTTQTGPGGIETEMFDGLLNYHCDGSDTSATNFNVPKCWATLFEPYFSSCTDLLIPKIDSVLSANATKFSDNWPQTFNELSYADAEDLRERSTVNTYATGETGIWRPLKSYTYLDDRMKSPDVNIRIDGSYNALPIFQWKNPFFLDEGCDATKKWRLVNTITKNDGNSNETENRNILDIYSSALFGYKGQLPIATAANSEKGEFGFEGFEEYDAGGSYNQFTNSTGNLDFVNSYVNEPIVHVLEYEVEKGDGLSATLNMPFADVDALLNGAEVKVVVDFAKDDLHNFPYQHGMYTLTVSDVIDELGKTKVNFNAGLIQSRVFTPNYLSSPINRCWKGKIIFKKNAEHEFTSQNVSYVTTKAHTGKNSMKVLTSAEFPMLEMQLNEGESYVLGAWVSKDQSQVKSYSFTSGHGPRAVIKFYNSSNTLLSSTSDFRPSGAVVEGWQKIEERFTVPAGTHHISVYLDGELYSADAAQAAYFDDIRIYPDDGNMKSYVYDRKNYKLRAVLDENNFATLYFYDEKGNLNLVKRETHKGVETIQESRQYIKQTE